MRWTRGKISRNIEDRRGQRAVRRAGGLGLGGLLLVILFGLITGQDFSSILGFLADSGAVGGSAPPVTASVPEAGGEVDQFVSFVLDDVQETWAGIFPRLGGQYREARLILFTDGTESGCGYAQSAMGPFYCPPDQDVYIDLSFFDELTQRFGAPGEFAQAYVLAHEIGHHVQTQLGIEQQVREAQERNRAAANQLSVRMELQADCFAGIWGNSTARRDILEAGDVESALNAAAAIGDDRLQRQAGGRVMPETFTHGSSAQRVEWFRRGLETGDVEACDTF